MKFLSKNLSFHFLIIISFVFSALRFPSLFEPDWYGDEGIYQVLGMGINAGRLLYRDIFDNKPPLLYLLYSFVNSDLFLIRFLSFCFGLMSVLAFYFLSKKFLTSLKSSFIATIFFAVLFALPLIEGNIANAENFMLLPNIISAILILKSIEVAKLNKKLLLLLASGLILGLSFLLKIVAVFDFVAFFSFIIISDLPNKLNNIFNKKYLVNEFTKLASYTVGFLIPILITVIFFTLNGALFYFLKATFFSNIGYVGYGNNLIIPQGLLILKLSLLFIFLIVFLIKRNSLPKPFIFACIWLGFSLFNTFFSQRPYTHYVLSLLPSFCLMIGFFAENNKLSKYAGILVLSIFILILLNFKIYNKTIAYYQNFISFTTGTKSIENYRRFFDGSTPRDYEIANYILAHGKSNTNTFIWGNNAQVYALINALPPGRYSVAYHITNYSDGIENTKQGLVNNPPQFIVIMPNVSKYPFLLSSYSLDVDLSGVTIYEKINK